MPKPSLYELIWSAEHQHYELSKAGYLHQRLRREDEQPWRDWLLEQTSFSFRGQHGRLSVIKEARPRGTGYWYAYSTRERQTRKRYLGQTNRVTLERLEEAALALSTESVATPQKKHGAQTFPTLVHPSSQSNVLLLETKYIPPRLPSALVKRERLLKDLDTIVEHRLLLCSASAGSGKTTLLSAWATYSPHQIAWLSLDELDNDPTRFWASVITALRTRLPEVGTLALAMLYAPQPPPLSTVLTTLINEFTGYSGDIILVLDDYHVIEDQVIQAAMLFWLDHLPPSLHIIISCRVDPGLPLSRWRMRRQMAEIRETDARFTLEEASTFLSRGMGLSLSNEEMKLLEDRTEGWIAGLQLAALSLRMQKDPSAFVQRFTGGQRFILDYVQEEIFQRQPLPTQHFLLQVAVLSRMNAALCKAVTEDPDCQELLETLERSNLFLVPLDERRQWYRLHILFREVLLTYLQATQPERISILHQRAAHWYEAQGYIREAIIHTLAAEDYSFAASVMERAAKKLWMNGEAKMVSTWVVMLPDTVLQAHREFALASVLSLLQSSQNMPEQQWAEALVQSEQIIVRVEHSIQNDGSLSEPEKRRLHHRICLLHGLIEIRAAFQESNIQQVRHIAQKLQPLTGQEQVAWKWIPLYGLIVSAQVLGDMVFLIPELAAIRQQALQEMDHPTAIVVMCWLAGAFLYGGQLRSLHQECLQAQEMLDQSGMQLAVGAYPALDLAFLYAAWNRLEEAEACLQRVITHAHHWQDTNLLLWSYSLSVRVCLASGKMVEAEQALREAQRLIHLTGLTIYTPEVMAAQVSLWLSQGDLSAAGGWATHISLDAHLAESIHEEEGLALARVYLVQQQYTQCLHLLAPMLSKMELLERIWNVVHILALQVVAQHACGELAQAGQVALRLLTLTEAEGYIRVYLDAGKPMQQVLKMLLDAPNSYEAALPAVLIPYVLALLDIFEQEEHGYSTGSAAPGTVADAASHSPTQTGLSEPLSPQEQRVLHLLVVGRTYAEIAQELIVSPNTIKTQVSSIYRKLNVSRRAEATTVARQLHLL